MTNITVSVRDSGSEQNRDCCRGCREAAGERNRGMGRV